jgi:hypothetical protein
MQHKQWSNPALWTWLLSLVLWGCRGLPFQLADGEGGAGGAETPTVESCEPANGAYPGPDCGVFVAAGGTGDGTPQAPFGSLNAALASGQTIYVCGEQLDEAVVIAGEATIYGGLSCGTWAYDESARTELTAPAGSVPLEIASAAALRIEGFRVAARSAVEPSGSSIAVIAQEGSQVEFVRCDLLAGNAAAGSDGAAGAVGENGEDGAPASSTAGGTGGLSSCGGAGGKGGNAGTGAIAKGSSGQPSSQQNGGAAGCTAGLAGQAGEDGAAAAPTAAGGSIDEQGYLPPQGSKGTNGASAGGGGGGGGLQGAGGGGGGAGGCAGEAGEPGGSGGSSMVVVSLGSALKFQDSTAVVGLGGDAGLGGEGGSPGMPGTPSAGFGSACSGGMGGVAGRGGDGAEGAGGHAVVIAYTGGEPSLNGLQVTPPNAEQAGKALSGENGTAAIALAF